MTGPRRAVLGLALLLPLAAGCGQKMVSVSGTVTWEERGQPKEPLKQGRILFEPEDGQGLPVSAEIKDGKYSTKVPPGRKKVQIHASRERRDGKVDPAMGAVPREQFIPPWYNEKTKLRAEVTEKGPNDFPFDLRDKE